jgi:DNA-binding CsgD family transcriptional regulator
VTTQRSPGFRGRARERETLHRLLDTVRGGASGVLVVRGDAGVGKTALLNDCAQQAVGCLVVQVTAVQSEMELAYAGVHQLCGPLLDGLDRLPPPQRDALATAFGLAAGAPPDRFFVGLAVLSLLADSAAEQPILCLIDDAQWLDDVSAQVLGFVARRLGAESVAMLFATRPPGAPDGLTGLSGLTLDGLANGDARALFRAVVPGPLDARIADRVIAETQGNPLALLELSHMATSTQLATGSDLRSARPLPERIEATFRQRIEHLPEPTQLLLLLAAAEPLGDPSLLWRAAVGLGLTRSDAAAAEADGLLTIGERVAFRHPLVRSAVYRAASPGDRQRVHTALVAATDPELDPDRRAWHRAHATPGPDEEVAAELQRSAGRAQARGGFAAAAAFLEEALRLTPEPAHRTERALDAALAKLHAGAPDAALHLVATAAQAPLDPLGRAQVVLLRGQIAFASSNGREAPPLLLEAARQLEPLDAALARDTYLDALAAALFVGRLASGIGIPEVARAAQTAPPSATRPWDLLLDGFAAVINDGYASGAPMLSQAVRAFHADDLPAPDAIRWLWLATHAAHDLWDDASWDLLSTRHIRLARQAGALAILPLALSARVGLHLFAGELSQAASLVEEITAVTDATRSSLPPYGALALAAWQGREADATELIEAVHDQLQPRGDGMGLTLVEHATAVLCNGLGRYEEACDAAERAATHPQEMAFSTWSLVQLIEAAARSHRPALAHTALQQLTATTGPSGTHWARGIEARSRALVDLDGHTEEHHRQAIDHLGRTRVRMELARAHLLYGEWLRREGRRTDAREQLRTAHEMFTTMGAEAFAERTRRELAASGAKARKRQDHTRDQLTPQEEQIARLAREGRTNQEIGAELYLSARTVEWHLRKVFTKLGISSRRDLYRALPAPQPHSAPA